MTDYLIELLSAATQQLVKDVRGPVSPRELDKDQPLSPDDFLACPREAIAVWAEYVHASDRSHRMRTMLSIWKEQQGQERRLRSIYAGCLVAALFAELVAANVAFFYLGYGILRMDRWIADVFFVGTFAQVTSMVFLVLRYLFPEKSTALLELLERLEP